MILFKRYTPLLAGLLLLAAMVSCKKSTGEGPNFHYTYFPYESGYWVEYNVDSMWHDNGSDTARYQLREVMADAYYDNEGRLSYRFERYKRDSSHHPWVLEDVWSVTRTQTRLERVEENIRLIKLLFPVKRNDRWDGNLYNVYDEEEYMVYDAHETMTINGFTFDSTAHVIQADRNNLVDSIYKEEIYAAGVGLVYRQFRELDFGNSQAGIIGNEYYLTVTGYGN